MAGGIAGGLVVGGVIGALAFPRGAETVTVTGTITREVTKEVTKEVEVPVAKKGWEGRKWIPIVNKFMTFKEVQDTLASEGTGIVANWTYWGLTDTAFAQEFKDYVAAMYDVDVKLRILGTQEAKGGFMFQLYSAYAAGLKAPYDLMHLESNFFEEAIAKNVAEPFLPSPLVPNMQLVDYYFLNLPYGIQFQNHALANFTVNTKQVGSWFNSWKSLADSRLKEKITLWVFEDNGFWGFLVVLAEELGKNYKNPDDMKEVLRWLAENVHPNVIKYTSDEAELDELLGRDISWASAYWCALAEGYSVTRPELKGSQVLPWQFNSSHVNLPGIFWIPKNVEHPLMAQVLADFYISPLHQLPDINKYTQYTKELWLRTEEGLLGPDYAQYVPDWVNNLGPKGIHEVYPTIEQARQFPKIDWVYVNENANEWINTYKELIGA
ncbi:hypothetical protein HRbin01_00094 [archaeon HR01]|nr:hypothetical protein HRbin01_00094 [archaeon HR01]